jgi:hypothetical protein
VATAASTISINFDILIFACAVESLIIVSRVLAVIGNVLRFLESTAWMHQEEFRQKSIQQIFVWNDFESIEVLPLKLSIARIGQLYIFQQLKST